MLIVFCIAALILFVAGIFWTLGVLFFIVKWAAIIGAAYLICNLLYEFFF